MSFETKFLKLTTNIDKTQDWLTVNSKYYDDIIYAFLLVRHAIMSVADCLDELQNNVDLINDHSYKLETVLSIATLLFETRDIIENKLLQKIREYHD
tara:strand:+ start:465 stop:755 length:291 start_codon:yes stop_codon:yes gene_type:complete